MHSILIAICLLSNGRDLLNAVEKKRSRVSFLDALFGPSGSKETKSNSNNIHQTLMSYQIPSKQGYARGQRSF